MQVTGNLSMNGVTRQVVIPMKYVGEGKGPYGMYRLGFYSQFVIRRSEFNMKKMLPKIGDDISITMSFEGIRSK